MTNHRRRMQVRRRKFDGMPPAWNNSMRRSQKKMKRLARQMRQLGSSFKRVGRVMDQFGRMVVPASPDVVSPYGDKSE